MQSARDVEVALRFDRPPLLLGLAAVMLLAPSLLLGTLPSHSSPQNLTWAAQFAEQFRAGVLYPRWMPDSFDSLGGPAFYFYPPLPFWLDALLSVVTFDAVPASYRLSLVSTLLLWLSGFAMHCWLRAEGTNSRIALIGALGYMAAPYHLIDFYIRGALGEIAAYAMLPLVIVGIRRIADDKSHGGFILLVVAYAALLFAHLPTALLISVTVVPAYVLFSAWRLRGKAALGCLARCALAGILGLGLAAIYLLPALALQSAISIEQLWRSGYSVDIWFLLTPGRWIAPHYLMLMVASVSAAWCVVAIGAIVVLQRSKAGGDTHRQAAFWALLCLVSLALMSGLVPWFWHVVPLVSKVQFPWRLLVVVEFAAITAACLAPWAKHERVAKAVFIAAVVAVAPGLYLTGEGIVVRTGLALRGESMPAQDVKEYLPAGYPQQSNVGYARLGLEPIEKLPPIGCAPEPRLCRAEPGRFGAMRIEVESDMPTEVVLRRFYFPAWRLEPALPIAPTEKLRLVSFTVLPGHNVVTLSRRALAEEQWGWAISGGALVLVLLAATFGRPRSG